ncbi:MAG TPA: Stk1 family PASTA domain-containing Ser/Thr kinase [Firmicutes bacterium]|nr:Stk1 family PASTA domain-containing Ser/Thr kinase [Bacillota bacterium]
MIGEVLVNRYEILEEVGSGGMARVYSAKDLLLNRIVAVKILREQFADDEQFVERFRREARSAASLSHPNIVNIYDVGETGGVHFIVMEFVHGKNLRQLIVEKKGFSQEFIVSVGKQIAMGLAHAHEHGIIHRDIKPHNILITGEGRVKVTDFGIAQAMSSSNLTQTGTVLGSVHYFSPEQARGVNVQAASDLYSLGIVLYEMITGRVPFTGESAVSIALMQIQDPPPPLRRATRGLDRDLEQLVLKFLAKEIKDRPSGAQEAVGVFQRIERRLEADGEQRLIEGDTLPLAAVEPGEEGGMAVVKGKKKQKGRRKLVIVLAVLVVLGGLGFGLVRLIPLLLFPDDVQVPSVVGLFELEGRRVLRSAGLILKVEQFVFDNEQPEGFIISQDPLPGRMVKENREIAVRVSKGPEEVEMLSVLGASTREAKLNLTQSGFVLGEQTEAFDPQALPNTILEQWPEPGEIVVKGTAVNLVINKGERGSAAVVVPDFKGREFSAVQAQLQELGLDVGNAWPEYSTIFAEGRIVEQNPRAGTEVEAGSRIDFVYSQGEAKPAAPETTPTEPKEEVEWVHENLWKTEEVTILVPPGGEQEVVILVIDDFGAREVYREKHEGGSRVVRTVQGRGEGAKLQVYIGARQFYDQKF